MTDILMKATEDITLGGTIFHKGDVIAIIEVKSTTVTNYFGSRFNEAMGGLNTLASMNTKLLNTVSLSASFLFQWTCFGTECIRALSDSIVIRISRCLLGAR